MKKILLCLVCTLIIGVPKMYADDDCIQSIVLQEIGLPTPMDDFNEESTGEPNPPFSHFRASISGNILQVTSNLGIVARLQVENNTSGEFVADKVFNTSTTSIIPSTGSYTVYIISNNTVYVGLFDIK